MPIAFIHTLNIKYANFHFQVGKGILMVPYLREHVARYHGWMDDPVILQQTSSERLSFEEELENQVCLIKQFFIKKRDIFTHQLYNVFNISSLRLFLGFVARRFTEYAHVYMQ